VPARVSDTVDLVIGVRKKSDPQRLDFHKVVSYAISDERHELASSRRTPVNTWRTAVFSNSRMAEKIRSRKAGGVSQNAETGRSILVM
jgi:hypothetical protein